MTSMSVSTSEWSASRTRGDVPACGLNASYRRPNMGHDAESAEADLGDFRRFPAQLALHESIGDVHDAHRNTALCQARCYLEAQHAGAKHHGPLCPSRRAHDALSVGHVLEHKRSVHEAVGIGDALNGGHAGHGARRDHEVRIGVFRTALIGDHSARGVDA